MMLMAKARCTTQTTHKLLCLFIDITQVWKNNDNLGKPFFLHRRNPDVGRLVTSSLKWKALWLHHPPSESVFLPNYAKDRGRITATGCKL